MEKIPYSRPNIDLGVMKDIEEVIKSGWLVEDKYTAKFQEKFSRYFNVDHAICTSSGTTALFLALKALGIKGDDEVIVPSLTFVATPNSVIHVGAKPIFADINKETFNIDPKSIMAKITKNTKAIMPVHLYGQSCEMDEIMQIAKEHNLKVIEDSAQAIGALYKNKKTGSMGDIGCFSFHPIKNMTTGEGGMITSNDKELIDKIKILKMHGMVLYNPMRQVNDLMLDREFTEIGYNFRIQEISAVIGLSQLEDLEKNNKIRAEKAKLYGELLDGVDNVRVPYVEPYNKHSYFAYTIKCKRRDKLMKFLLANNISCLIRPPPVHLEPVYRKLFNYKEGFLPTTEQVADEILCLPMFPTLSDENVTFICNEIKEFYSTSA